MKRLMAALVPLALIAMNALAQEDATWREELEYQMFREHDCEVNYLTNVEVKRVDGDAVIYARVHCLDRRAFDVTRARSGTKFKVTECTTEVC